MLEDMKVRLAATAKAMQTSGVRVVHSVGAPSTKGNFGGVTLAYRKHPTDPRIEVALAICSPSQQFHRGSGRILAVEAFMAGETLMVPNFNEVDVQLVALTLAETFCGKLG